MKLNRYRLIISLIVLSFSAYAQQASPSALKKATPLATFVAEKVNLTETEKNTFTEIIAWRDEMTAQKVAGLPSTEKEAIQKETYGIMVEKLKEKFPKDRLALIIAARIEYFNVGKQRPSPVSTENMIAQKVTPVISAITEAVSFTPAETGILTEIFTWRERSVTEQLKPELSAEERKTIYYSAYDTMVLKLKEKFSKEKVDAIMAARKKHYEIKTP